jgi:hypothetical protein
MAGDANDAEVPKICRFIICSRAAFWEATLKKISSPCAVDVIERSISELKYLRCSSEEAIESHDAYGACFARDYPCA